MEMRGRDKFQKYKKLLRLLAKIVKMFPLKVRKRVFETVRYIKGNIGIAIRYILLSSIAKSVGDNVSIREGVHLFELEKLSVGSNVSIHSMCYIDAAGGIDIGNDVSIAHGTTIMSSSHIFDDANISIKDQGLNFRKTIIEDNVWIGAKATILAGVIVREGSVVGANSLVNKEVLPFSIVGGVPARLLRERK